MTGTQLLRSDAARRARLFATDYGVRADNSTNDAVALQAAIDAAAAGFSGGQGADVILPAGIILVGAQIKVKNKTRLIGAGKRSTAIKAISGTFPTTTPIVRLGDGSGIVFDCRVENLLIDANGVTGSTCLHSSEGQEGSGAEHVLVQGYLLRGIYFDGCSQVQCYDIEASPNAAGSTAGVAYHNCAGTNTIEWLTVNGSGGTHVDGFNFDLTNVNCLNVHVEGHTNGINSVAGTGTIIGASGHSTVTNLITLGAGTNSVTCFAINRNASTHTLADGFNFVTLDDSFIRFYCQGPMYLSGGTPIINNRGSIPSTSGSIKGTICWNNNPSTGTPVGWICTVSGSPDTWKGFGVVL